MRPTLWDSALTFRRGVGAKLSFVLLNQIDLVLTVLALSLGFQEVNPLMRTLAASPFYLLLMKLAIPLMVAWLVPGRLLIPAIVLLALIVGWDVKELLVVFL
ncbi:MAG: DUF5658 family protein [Chloroflexota bacterium]|nr:DUF5658 family protein [Chloroflexota bacterium]